MIKIVKISFIFLYFRTRGTVVDPPIKKRIRNFQAQLFGKFVQRSACLSQNIQQN